MPFCSRCGSELTEGQEHVCSKPIITSSAASQTSKIDVSMITSLLKKPFNALDLVEQEHFIYGVLGICLVVVGVFFWIWGVYHNITSGIAGIPFIGKLVSPNYFKLFIIGIIIGLPLMASMYGFSTWLGQRNFTFKQNLTVLGSAQWVIGLAYSIGALLSFISLPISIGAFLITLITHCILLATISFQHFTVTDEKKTQVMFLAVSVYIVVMGLLIKSSVGSIGGNLMKSITGGF